MGLNLCPGGQHSCCGSPRNKADAGELLQNTVEPILKLPMRQTAEIEQCLCGSSAPDHLGHFQVLDGSVSKYLQRMVGERGFEPPTRSRTRSLPAHKVFKAD
jgi:hypothetical protein